MKNIVLVLLSFFIFIKPVFAGEPPTQISPENNSTVSSSSLNWQTPSYTLYSSNPYRVQVDDDPSFPSTTINKNYYTKNTYYSPILNEGTWYWRVKAKDSSEIWSDWSNTWSFNLQSTQSPTSIPSPTSPPSPSPSPSPAPTSSSSTTSSSFTISGVPSQINSDQSFSVAVNLTLPNNPNTTFYLKGAFKKSDSSNYFGLTKVSGSWIKNGSTYSNQYPITTDSAGNWSGNLEIKPDSEDSGFTGTGDYIFKVGRYTSVGSGPTWSNESNIQIVSAESSRENTALTTASNDSSSITNPSTVPSAKSKVTSNQSKSYDRLVYHTATVAAATASNTLQTELKSQKQTNYISWVGLFMIATGTSIFAYVYLQSKDLRETIFNLFRKRN